ncbi:ribonuclease H-like protein [Annulohypoxylon maeteangense]|uniref:ribonuclease H-like protein n=1 Tax=Annulohypoxylon maeteangense TaxID=1927788 RepID=UPI0020082B39|nr:ribonuclease H-like protein [Annulohypoxylon maeteangense]KAI0883308.1 ribonuclease H-like protein [Annulohypoxylon maeteangense]
MTSLAGSEIVSNALRSRNVLRASLTLRNWVIRNTKMAITPPKYQLWHPTRGISFSPITRSPVLTPEDAQTSNEAAAAADRTRSAASHPGDLDDSFLYPKLEGLSLSTPKRNTQEITKTVGEGAYIISLDKQANLSETTIPDGPPISELPFKMMDDLFYAAKKAPAGSTGSFWSYNQYRAISDDGTKQKVKVHYCRSTHTMEKVCQEFFKDEKVLGFDLEWAADSTKASGFRRNVSLIQLASPSRIGLFHVALFANKDDILGPTFKAIMEDSNITKVGVAIKGDATRLRNFFSVDSKGLLELSHLYKLVTHSATGRYSEINKRLVTLASQVEQYLHLPLYKGQDVRSSDWTKPLRMDQVIYSSSDAYAGLQLYATLEYHRKQLDPCPPTPYHAERDLPIRLAYGALLAINDDPVVDATEEMELEATAPTKPKRTSSKLPPGTKDSRVEIAEDRVARYKSSHLNTRATFVQLRAYYMWHEQGLDPQTIAALLRDPPLKLATVTSYILTAIQTERFPADMERLGAEILSTMLEDTLQSRWPYIAALVSKPSL